MIAQPYDFGIEEDRSFTDSIDDSEPSFVDHSDMDDELVSEVPEEENDVDDFECRGIDDMQTVETDLAWNFHGGYDWNGGDDWNGEEQSNADTDDYSSPHNSSPVSQLSQEDSDQPQRQSLRGSHSPQSPSTRMSSTSDQVPSHLRHSHEDSKESSINQTRRLTRRQTSLRCIPNIQSQCIPLPSTVGASSHGHGGNSNTTNMAQRSVVE